MFTIFKGWSKYDLDKAPKKSLTRINANGGYSDCWASGLRTGEVYDKDIYKYVVKHTHWWNRIDTHFISDCVLQAQDILYGYVKPPKNGKWYFEDYPYGHEIEAKEWEMMDKEKYIKEYLRE